MQDVENVINKKKALLYEARTMMNDRAYDPERVDSILASYAAIISMNTAKERELDEQYRRLKERNKNICNRHRENSNSKQRLIAEAQSLQNSTDWKATSQRMKAMMEEWKAIGNAGKENDRLWAQFIEARQVFYDNQERNFQKVAWEREQHRQKKEALIEEAKQVAYSTDWKAANAKMDDLLNQWKKAGSAGKDNDDKLWSAFQEARNTYYSRRNADRAEKERQFTNRRQQKANLINEASNHYGDYSSSTADRMKQLSSEWKSIGSCGKAYDEDLWRQFKQAQDRYWMGKKECARAKIEAAIARRREKVSRLYSQNQDLRDRMNTTRNSANRDRLYGYISENEGKIRELELEIGKMEQDLWK